MPKKIYISGPISEMPDGNRAEFARVEAKLKSFGFDVVNPHNLFEAVETNGFKWRDFMNECLKALTGCDEVVTLAGWDMSRGAKLEVHIARALDMEVIPETRL